VKPNKPTGADFEYSRLDPSFAGLSKPAKRALLQHGLFGPRELSRWRLKDVIALHGIGPSAVPILKTALRQQRLDFLR
jgi:hypothetical protein